MNVKDKIVETHLYIYFVGQGYGGYQGYNAMGGNQYGANAAAYNSMQPAAQYAQPAYPNYGKCN